MAGVMTRTARVSHQLVTAIMTIAPMMTTKPRSIGHRQRRADGVADGGDVASEAESVRRRDGGRKGRIERQQMVEDGNGGDRHDARSPTTEM